MNQRIVWIDWAKAIGIFLVVWGHCDISYSSVGRYLYVLRMPLFFFISGYLAKNSLPFAQLIQKCVKRLVIPYLFFNGLMALFFLIKGILLEVNGEDPAWETRLVTPGIATIFGYSTQIFCISTWFLLALFWCRILGYIYEHCSAWRRGLLLGCWFLLFLWVTYSHVRLPFCFDTALLGFIWYLLGYLTSRFPKEYSISSTLKVLIGIGGFILSYLLSLRYGVCSYIDSDPNGLWGLFTSVLAVYAFCCICQLVGRFRLLCVEVVSKATLFILGTHVFLIVFLESVLHFKEHIGYSFIVSIALLCSLSYLYFIAKKTHLLNRAIKAIHL